MGHMIRQDGLLNLHSASCSCPAALELGISSIGIEAGSHRFKIPGQPTLSPARASSLTSFLEPIITNPCTEYLRTFTRILAVASNWERFV